MTDITKLVKQAGFIPSEDIGNFIGDRDNFAKLEQLLCKKFIAELGEPVAWMLKTGHGTALEEVKPYCEIDYWKPLYALKDNGKVFE